MFASIKITSSNLQVTCYVSKVRKKTSKMKIENFKLQICY